jgi:two-component system cell cycle sensor histidine kinase/response regulator CckA
MPRVRNRIGWIACVLLVAFALLVGREASVHRRNADLRWHEARAIAERPAGTLHPSSVALDTVAFQAWERRLDAGIARHLELTQLARDEQRDAQRLNWLAAYLLLAAVALGIWLRGRARVSAVARDAEHRMREWSEDRFRALVHNAADVIVVLDSGDRVTFASPSSSRLVGWPPEEMMAGGLDRLLHPDDSGPLHLLVEGCRAGEGERLGVLRLRHRDGHWVDAEVVASDQSRVPSIGGVVLSVRDVSARRQAEQSLRASEQRFRALFEGHPQPLWMFDAETLRFVEVNASASKAYGWSRDEFLAMTVADIRPEADRARLVTSVSTLTGSMRNSGLWTHRRKDGETFEVEIHSFVLTVGGRRLVMTAATDVSERRRLEDELRQAQKMEAMGRLAGGVAHDFNNMITAVQGYADLLRRELDGQEQPRAWCDEILRASSRASSLTRQLLAFSRKQAVQPVVLDLNRVLVDMHRLLARLLGEDVDLVTSPAGDLGRVLADPGQMEQIIMNLAVNARDAMPRGGMLTIETANVDLEPEYVQHRVGMQPGLYVRLSVTDTGCGMTPEVRSHIFEPFYTTKEAGRGTGLGLATVYAIVQQNHGGISVYSEPGEGSTFTLYLPRVDVPAAQERSEDAPRAELARAGETVLLVEDAPQVRELAAAVLRGAGFRVLEAPHGEAALALAAGHDGPIHLLVSDLVMPGIRGTELAQRIIADRPATRVLFMSGYADDASMMSGYITADTPFIHKPFTPDDLLRHARRAIDGAVPGTA